MARRIIWTSLADRIFTGILEFYVERNGSKLYSRKLNNELQTLLKILAKQPYTGLKTDFHGIRVIIKSNFKIFYEVRKDELVVHLVWDCRQNPELLRNIK